MVQIQIDLTDEENHKLEIYQGLNGITSKGECIKKLIRDINVREVFEKAVGKPIGKEVDDGNQT